MNYRSFLTGIAAGLLLFVQTGLSVEAAIPADAHKDIKYILAYYGNGENILIRENKDVWNFYTAFQCRISAFLANIYPFVKESFRFLFDGEAPMSIPRLALNLNATRWYGITCRVGGNRYTRYYFGQKLGGHKAFQPACRYWKNCVSKLMKQ